MILFCRALIAGIMFLVSEFIGHHGNDGARKSRVSWKPWIFLGHWSWWSVSANPYSGPNTCLHSRAQPELMMLLLPLFSEACGFCSGHYLMNRLFYIRISPFLSSVI